MRLRLVHQISLLLLATVVVAVLAMAGVVAWNLRAGFVDYLRAQDARQLDRLMRVAERDLALGGGLDQPGRTLHRWLDEADEVRQLRLPDGRPPDPRRPGDEERSDGLPPRGPLDHPRAPSRPPRAREDGRRPLAPPAPPPERSQFGGRLVLLDADGRTALAGRAETLQLPGQLRALKRDGQTLAHLRLAERAGPSEDVDRAFLQRQYTGLAVVAGAVILLALVAARMLAARWLRPLQQVRTAARRLAGGEFKVRIPARREDELGELIHDINAMAASLQRLEASRRRWVAELAHELRTPLAVLRGELEALADGVRPLQLGALTSLQDEVQRLTRLTDDFHLLALSDLRELPCSPHPLALTPLLQEALGRVRARAEAAGLALELDLPAALPEVCWDGERIAQLLANLLENSLRYTDAPGRIRLSVRQQPGLIELSIDDSPPGVPAAALEQLFDPLYRVEGSRSRASGGSGLGLGVAQAIARSHGGSLRAEASPLGGLCMKLRLPLQARESER